MIEAWALAFYEETEKIADINKNLMSNSGMDMSEAKTMNKNKVMNTQLKTKNQAPKVQSPLQNAAVGKMQEMKQNAQPLLK
jgi:hypothetical protein